MYHVMREVQGWSYDRRVLAGWLAYLKATCMSRIPGWMCRRNTSLEGSCATCSQIISVGPWLSRVCKCRKFLETGRECREAHRRHVQKCMNYVSVINYKHCEILLSHWLGVASRLLHALSCFCQRSCSLTGHYQAQCGRCKLSSAQKLEMTD